MASHMLAPTVPVSWSFADYLAGKDTAIEGVLKLKQYQEQRSPAPGSAD